MSNPYAPEPMAQGIAKPATQAEIDKEATYTDPNLHRRIDDAGFVENNYTIAPSFVPGMYFIWDSAVERYLPLDEEPNDWATNYNDGIYHQTYSVGVFGTNSYRIIQSNYYDEESTESEIP